MVPFVFCNFIVELLRWQDFMNILMNKYSKLIKIFLGTTIDLDKAL